MTKTTSDLLRAARTARPGGMRKVRVGDSMVDARQVSTWIPLDVFDRINKVAPGCAERGKISSTVRIYVLERLEQLERKATK